jgi:hypothetical protein
VLYAIFLHTHRDLAAIGAARSSQLQVNQINGNQSLAVQQRDSLKDIDTVSEARYKNKKCGKNGRKKKEKFDRGEVTNWMYH